MNSLIAGPSVAALVGVGVVRDTVATCQRQEFRDVGFRAIMKGREKHVKSSYAYLYQSWYVQYICIVCQHVELQPTSPTYTYDKRVKRYRPHVGQARSPTLSRPHQLSTS